MVAPSSVDGLLQQFGQAVAVKNIVAQDQADGVAGDEFLADQEGVGQAARLLLDPVGKADSQPDAVTEQASGSAAGRRGWR